MATDWREAAIGDVRTMMSKANLSRRFSNVIIGLHSVGAFSYGIGVLVSHTDDTLETPEREFTLKMQLPFECNESPFYELVMCVEFLHQLASSAITGILNSLIVTLVSGICERKKNNILSLNVSRLHFPQISESDIVRDRLYPMYICGNGIFIRISNTLYIQAKRRMRTPDVHYP